MNLFFFPNETHTPLCLPGRRAGSSLRAGFWGKIAECYGSCLQLNGHTDPWHHMFAQAAAEPDRGSDLTPFWIYPKGRAFIERHVPTLPMSREIGRLANLRRSLALYRMVSGQPRQDDLLDHLLHRLPRDQILSLLDQLQINLAPPTQDPG